MVKVPAYSGGTAEVQFLVATSPAMVRVGTTEVLVHPQLPVRSTDPVVAANAGLFTPMLIDSRT